jgi:hypothetical protein
VFKNTVRDVGKRRYGCVVDSTHSAIASDDERMERSWLQLDVASRCLDFNADGKEIVAWAFSPEHLLDI